MSHSHYPIPLNVPMQNRPYLLKTMHTNNQRIMTLREFQLQNDYSQAEKLMDAVCIAGRDEGEHKVLLYQLDAFYVEVFYHPRRNIITRYRGFENMDELDVYLDRNDLVLS